MNENLEFDYTVTKKPEGKYKTKRILAIVGYVLFALIFFFGLYLAHLYQFIAFIVLVEWILIFFTWRYLSIEYKYVTESGCIRFYNVYGGKKKCLVLDLKIRDFDEIAPCDSDIKKNLDSQAFDAVYSFVRSERDFTDVYYATFHQNDKKSLVYFEVTQKSLKIMKFYNGKTVMTETGY